MSGARLVAKLTGRQDGSSSLRFCRPAAPAFLTAALETSSASLHPSSSSYAAGIAPLESIQTAIAIIIRFSVSEMKPSGTLLSPPTQAHFNSRLSM